MLAFLILPTVFAQVFSPFRYINTTVIFDEQSYFVTMWDNGENEISLKEFFSRDRFISYLVEESHLCAHYDVIYTNENYELRKYFDCMNIGIDTFYYYIWECNDKSFILEAYTLLEESLLNEFMTICNRETFVRSYDVSFSGCSYVGSMFSGFLPDHNMKLLIEETNQPVYYENSDYEWVFEDGTICGANQGLFVERWCIKDTYYSWVMSADASSIYQLPEISFNSNLLSVERIIYDIKQFFNESKQVLYFFAPFLLIIFKIKRTARKR